MSALLADGRSIRASPAFLELISIDLNLNAVEAALRWIPDLLKTLTNPLDKTRIQNCQADLDYVHGKLNDANTAAGKHSFLEAKDLLIEALIKIGECYDEYDRPPKRESPISDLTFKMGGANWYFFHYNFYVNVLVRYCQLNLMWSIIKIGLPRSL